MERMISRNILSSLKGFTSLITLLINHERLGHLRGTTTQKPVALLKRIIQSSSNPGDLVLDCFCVRKGTKVLTPLIPP